MSRTEAITCLLQKSERMGGGGYNDASTVAAAVGEKAHLGMK